jgi:hypothetical protein
MREFDGSLAMKLDFGEVPTRVTSTGTRAGAGLRLASRPSRLAGPDKYRILDGRRRKAQIRARRILELIEE